MARCNPGQDAYDRDRQAYVSRTERSVWSGCAGPRSTRRSISAPTTSWSSPAVAGALMRASFCAPDRPRRWIHLLVCTYFSSLELASLKGRLFGEVLWAKHERKGGENFYVHSQLRSRQVWAMYCLTRCIAAYVSKSLATT